MDSGTVTAVEFSQAVLHDRVRASLVNADAHTRPIENRVPIFVRHFRELNMKTASARPRHFGSGHLLVLQGLQRDGCNPRTRPQERIIPT